MVEPVGTDNSQCPAGILRLNVRAVRFRRLLAQHRRRAVFQCLADILVTVGGKARHGHEQVAGLCAPGVIADTGDFRLQIRRSIKDGDPGKQFLQFHSHSSVFGVLFP